MDDRKEKNGWMSVPEFGGWNQKATRATDYSMVFSRARANRKHNKTDLTEFKRTSLGNDQEFIAAAANHHADHQDDSILRKKKILTYINCCIRP